MSILQGFNVCLLFYLNLWPLTEPKTRAMNKEEQEAHILFFVDICAGLKSCGDWNEAIFRITGIPKEEQKKELGLSRKQLLSCTIGFCRLYNEALKGLLSFTLKKVQAMQEHPKGYPLEWSLWKQAVADSYIRHAKSWFDWSCGLYSKELENKSPLFN